MIDENAKKECIRRMKKLGMHENVLKEFENGKLNYSELQGILFWVSDEKVLAKVKELENEYNITVYHLIHHKAEFGECWCFLYVDNEETDYKHDEELLNDYLSYAYVWNIDDEICSEFGVIGIIPSNGGLIRVS